MNWSIRLALFRFMLFSTQIIFGAEQVTTPWESTQMAESFIANFLRAIERSSAFYTNQLVDMSTIQKTLTEAMEKFNSSNMSSKIKFQALNMVFASAISEITAAEYGGVSIESKTKEIENALNTAFQETTGIRNLQFVDEIKNLIFILSHPKGTGVSNASVVNEAENKQGSLGQLEPSTSVTAVNVRGSAPQRGIEIEHQGPSVVQPSKVLNVTGGYGPTLPAVTKQQEPQFERQTEQHAKGSKVSLSIKNSQGFSGFSAQTSAPQVPSVQDQLGPGRYGTGASITSATGGGMGPSMQLSPTSRVNGLGQQNPGYYDQIGEEPNSQGKFGVAGQGSSGNGLTQFGSYGQGSVTLGLQRPLGIGEKGYGTQESSKTGEQRSGDYEARAQASASIDQKEAGSGAIGGLGARSSAYREERQGGQGTSDAVDQRTEVYKLGYGLGAASSISEGVVGFRTPISTVGPQASQELTGKSTEGPSSYESRTAGTIVSGNNMSGTGTGRVQQEVQDIRRSSRTGIRGQGSANQGQNEVRYQETSRFEGQGLGDYSPGADGTAAAAVGVSRGQAKSGQKSLEVGGQRLGSLRLSDAESPSVTYGFNEYRHDSAAAATTVIESSSSAKGLQGPSNDESALEGSTSYASGSSTATAGPARGNGSVEPLISRMSTPHGSSKVSPTASSLLYSNPTKTSTIPNAVSSNAVSSASSLVSSNPTKISALSNAVNSIESQIGIANPGLSYCNVHIQTMLEIIADLVYLLGYCN